MLFHKFTVKPGDWMKILKEYAAVFCLATICLCSTEAQNTEPNQKGFYGQQNIDDIANISPISIGGKGFDTRYEGVQGSPMLFSEMLPALVKVNSLTRYLQINSNLDVYKNQLNFIHPVSGKQMMLPIDIIDEVIINSNEGRLYFRTTRGMSFDHPSDKIRFCQVLYSNGATTIIRIESKSLLEADYKKLYSPDRRYDEFYSKVTYYEAGMDLVFHKIPATKKSLLNVFPGKADLIEATLREKKFGADEDIFHYVVKKIASADSVK